MGQRIYHVLIQADSFFDGQLMQFAMQTGGHPHIKFTAVLNFIRRQGNFVTILVHRFHPQLAGFLNHLHTFFNGFTLRITPGQVFNLNEITTFRASLKQANHKFGLHNWKLNTIADFSEIY